MGGHLLLGIDLGTSGVKAGVYDSEARLLGLGRARSYPVISSHPGWSESDPELWWDGAAASVRDACEAGGVSPADVGAVGMSVFFPALVPMSETGESLRPAILYNDQRSLGEVDAILDIIDREAYQRRIGNVLVPGTCAVTSMLWLKEHEPEIYRSSHTLGMANTFLASRLCGEHVTDYSNASLTGLVHGASPQRWSTELCDLMGIDPGKLPRIVAPSQVVGFVGGEGARMTGLQPGTPVVAGMGDAAASAYGAGAVDESTVIYITGSTDCVTSPFSRPTEDLRWLNSGYIREDIWFGIGTMTSSGVSVEWFASQFYTGEQDQRIQAMIQDAASVEEKSSPELLYLPYLQGERTPIWDPRARGAFFGLTTATTRADMARAVFQGTALGLRDVVRCLEDMRGPVTEIRACGGGGRNSLWTAIKADALGRSIDVLGFQEMGSLGGALLAGVGTGVFPSHEHAAGVARGAAAVTSVDPDPARSGRYDELYELYTSLYAQTRDIAHALE